MALKALLASSATSLAWLVILSQKKIRVFMSWARTQHTIKELRRGISMAIDARTFETLTPSRFITFTFPNPNPNPPSSHGSLLRVAVLDSPTIQPTADQPPRVAAMLVPEHREHDWIFSTESGHVHLLLNSPGISRLVLIGNVPITVDSPPVIYNRLIYDDEYTIYRAKLEVSLLPLLIALSPISCIHDDSLFDIPFLSYEDNVKHGVILEKCVGSCIGEMLVENVEIECNNGGSKREFRRRLVFKRMPNLIQTEIRIVPVRGLDLDSFGIGEVEFEPDLGVLVHPYLAPMVAGLSLVGDRIEERTRCGIKPKALCLGVGGGALLGFLRTQLGFEVMGVEEDMEVVRVAKLYFGLKDDETIQIGIGDGIEMVKNLSDQGITWNSSSFSANEVEKKDINNLLNAKFDVVMVDLDSSDIGNGIVAPPLEFVRKPVLLNARLILRNYGILVINVIPPNMSFYQKLIIEFKDIFCELYEIEVGNEENYVLIASVSPIVTSFGESANSFLKKLKMAVSGVYIDSIRKI